jgi:chitin synthase
MPRPIELDIDTDDPFSPVNYRAHLAHQRQQQQQQQYDGVDAAEYADAHVQAPPLVRPQFSNGPAPQYREIIEEDGGVYYNEKSLIEEDLGRQYERYSTPELEGGGAAAGLGERSFDGPDYESTEGGHQATPRRPYAMRYDTKETPRTRQRRFVEDDEFDEKMGLGASVGPGGEDEALNPHFGSAPSVQLRRNRTKKRVALSNGNLVIDAPIPSRLSGFLPRKGQEEFDKMRCVARSVCYLSQAECRCPSPRYTAVTCDVSRTTR